ncbi:unnamed protein product [Thlaspi arvense]|uniref:Protein transport protein Sec61 subunit beta n=1 Tax=Thlaspi arvense TaxID=13288 RepID=A0AAU9SCC9_THLAR|nr:unnamed protein product [Thlaspi arvense]
MVCKLRNFVIEGLSSTCQTRIGGPTMNGVSLKARSKAKMVGGGAPQRGSAAATASMRRRKGGSSSSAGGGASGGGAGSMLQFYTDDAPGLKISPNVVLIMSIGFIAFVAVLHVMGKLYFVKSK